MRRWVLRGTLAAGLVGAAAVPLWAPPALQRIAWFDAREIEVSGTRLLAPHEVLHASGVRPGVSVWTDPAAWEAALLRHPVLAEAEVTRRLPHTLRIRVVEREPVALVQEGVLRLATAEGRILPVAPAASPVDLPLLRLRAGAVRDARVSDAAGLAALTELARLREADPGLLARASEVRPEAGAVLRLSLPAVEVLLPAGADGDRLRHVAAAMADAARRAAPDTGTILVDARWADQVVVRIAHRRTNALTH